MKIAILGYGLEGESAYQYWSADKSNHITICDQKTPDKPIPSGVDTVFGENYLDSLFGYDLIIRTPAVNKNDLKTDGKVWSATNEVFNKCPAQIIGVTGTKGKGTTASLIAKIFQVAGKKVWLTGNIGDVLLKDLPSIKPDDIVVYELSSFQLWDIQKSPHIAVVNIIEPEHLNVHTDFDDYVEAKSNIRRFQTDDDFCIYHPTNQYSAKVACASKKGRAIRFGDRNPGGVYVEDGYFCCNEQTICSINALQLVGPHNLENACAAITVAKIYGVPDADIEKALHEFQGLPHRLEYVRELSGVKYYNDSFSSSTPATVAAIKSFDSPEVLIIGGVDRGGDFGIVGKAVSDNLNVKTVILIGEARHKIAKSINEAGYKNQLIISDLSDMDSIVKLASSCAVSGDIVILSPGCGSFDMFKNFYDRGEQFKDCVNKL